MDLAAGDGIIERSALSAASDVILVASPEKYIQP